MKRLAIIAIIALASLALSGCLEGPEVYSVQQRQYEIVNIKQPKHFRVDLRDVDTNIIHRNVSASKHCNRWREVYTGKRVFLTETTYRYPAYDKWYATRTESWSSRINARSVCPGY